MTRHVLTFLAFAVGASGGRAEAALIDFATYPSMVIGSDGRGIIAYHASIGRDLRVARCDDADCTSVTSVLVDSPAFDGASIALTPAGLPVISYRVVAGIKVALCADVACTSASTVLIDSPVTGSRARTDIAVGTDGFPLVVYTVYVGGEDRTLRVAHCENAGCTVRTLTDIGPSTASSDLQPPSLEIAIAGDGRGSIVAPRTIAAFFDSTDFRHCADVPCTSAPIGSTHRLEPLVSGLSTHPSIAIAPDGLPVFTYSRGGTSGPANGVYVVRCADQACSTFNSALLPASGFGRTSIAIGADNRPHVVARGVSGDVRHFECLDATCASVQDSCLAPPSADYATIALDGAGDPLVAYLTGTDPATRITVARPGAPCAPSLAVADARAVEDGAPPHGTMLFAVGLTAAATSPVTVAYATSPGTAGTGDYTETTGVLTFAPGELHKQVAVPLTADAQIEGNETFVFQLHSWTGAAVLDNIAIGTIEDNDFPSISTGDCVAVEGDAGTRGCVIDVRLSRPYPNPVSARYDTQGLTATSGVDFLAQSGLLTFIPGSVQAFVSVSVVGDVVGEPEETFQVLLSNLVNASAGDTIGTGLIIDDDGPSLSTIELTHGAALGGSFAARPGPVADVDNYRFAFGPYASYEFVLDAVSGDAAPGARIELVANDGTTVVQQSDPVGTGAAASLRVRNFLDTTIASRYVRVTGASCTTACGVEDTYRLRAYETTGFIPRFNNSGTQITVLILQNTTEEALQPMALFWGANGTFLGMQGAMLAPRGVAVIQTAALPFAVNASGSITVVHDGRFGAIAAKAVALEPGIGFSFDSPMVIKGR